MTDPRPQTPDVSRLFALGGDHHEVPAPLDRILENLLDWEHFPYIHPDSFASSELLGSGLGWRRVRLGNTSGTFNDVLLLVDRRDDAGSRWFIALESGPNVGYVVETLGTVTSPRSLRTEIRFWGPTAPRNEAARRATLGAFQAQYDLFYAQDVAMMCERQRALDALAAGSSTVAPGGSLGPTAEVLARCPFQITIDGRRFWVVAGPDGPRAVGADCPHLLGPLTPPGPDHVLSCPWHGYRFDAKSETSCDGRGLRLARAPVLRISGGEVRIEG